MPAGATQRDAAPSSPPSRFRRARPGDAVDVAFETFMSGERVDMQTLAGRLDVSPATLYRWFGTRAELLDRVCGRITEQFADAAAEQCRGEGDERVCDYARRIMLASTASEAILSFVTREQQAALRLFLRRDSSVHRVLADRTSRVIAEARGGADPDAPGDATHLIVQVATAMIWATFLVGEEPDLDAAAAMVGMILASDREGGPAAGS